MLVKGGPGDYMTRVCRLRVLLYLSIRYSYSYYFALFWSRLQRNPVKRTAWCLEALTLYVCHIQIQYIKKGNISLFRFKSHRGLILMIQVTFPRQIPDAKEEIVFLWKNNCKLYTLWYIYVYIYIYALSVWLGEILVDKYIYIYYIYICVTQISTIEHIEYNLQLFFQHSCNCKLISLQREIGVL